MPLPSAVERARGLNRAERALEEIPVEERAIRAIRPLLDFGERSRYEEEFELQRADEAEIQAAVKAGNLIPYLEYKRAQERALVEQRRDFTLLNFSRWSHAASFERAVRAKLSGARLAASLRAYKENALRLMRENEKMRSVLLSNGRYYGNAHTEIFWSQFNEWCRQRLASLPTARVTRFPQRVARFRAPLAKAA
jgi:hypothetical protein